MWWDGAQHCFFQSSDIVVGGVGFIQSSEFEVLERKKSSLAATIQQVLQDPSPQALTQQECDVLTHWHVQLLKTWDHLSNYPVELQEKCLQVTEFQHIWLELDALHLYITWVTKELNTHMSAPKNPWKTMGGFTSSINEAQDCFHAGILVIFICLKVAMVGPIHINKVVPFHTAESCGIKQEPYTGIPFPLIFEGSLQVKQHYESQLYFLRNRHLPEVMVHYNSPSQTPGKLTFCFLLIPPVHFSLPFSDFLAYRSRSSVKINWLLKAIRLVS